jgi:hypothetical protein
MRRSLDDRVSEALVGTLFVDGALERAFAEHDHAAEALLHDRADEAFRWRPANSLLY